MILRIFIIVLLLFNFSFASFQKVRIGKIDKYYYDKISEDEFRNIIDEIEYSIESELGINIFDYSNSGKDINLIYVPPSRLENRISNYVNKLKSKENQIRKQQKSFPKEFKDINILKEKFAKKNNLLTKRVKKFNNYIHTINKKKNFTKKEYNEIQTYIKKHKVNLDKDLKKLKKEESFVKKRVNSYNAQIRLYNKNISDYNRLNKEIEVMSRSYKKVKGMTFGTKEIRLKSYYKNGKLIKEKDIKRKMNKIDIYGFDSINELKAILAHEIMHLVGLTHVNSKNALMNPVIQQNQIINLSLTRDDIENFNENF